MDAFKKLPTYKSSSLDIMPENLVELRELIGEAA
jgi:hypothetical protein